MSIADADNKTLAFLADAMVGGTDYAADRLEGGEQAKAVATTNLPRRCEDRPAWEALGVVFGESVDDLFCKATLPPGWSVKATGHNMWNEIQDDQGRKRGSYFYKGSFWDRSAHMNGPERRYRAGRNFVDDLPRDQVQAIVRDGDGDKIIWRSDLVDRVAGASPQPVVLEACAWLSENYPDHNDAGAYWGEV